ncbi:MAG: hypothetical protein LBJ59_01010 [Zoogloeaceae bacterium]|jgi:hypothetical protein|nr:hypothetical protein [Zoogloeaceae bacterium]
MSSATSATPGCRDCAHYAITHDARQPYACRAMNFKSARAPALDVLEASGASCLWFKAKPRWNVDPAASQRSGP